MSTTATRARKAPAKTAGATTPAKSTAAPAAKTAAKKGGENPLGLPKVKWTYPEGRDERLTTGQDGVLGGATYQIRPVDGGWKATVKVDGKTTVLGDKVSHQSAYKLCVAHARGDVKQEAA